MAACGSMAGGICVGCCGGCAVPCAGPAPEGADAVLRSSSGMESIMLFDDDDFGAYLENEPPPPLPLSIARLWPPDDDAPPRGTIDLP